MPQPDGRAPITVLGVPVHLHPSLALIAVLAIWSTSTQLRPVAGSLVAALLLGIVASIGMLGSILWHELAHARQGHRHGLHVGGVTLFVFGGVTAIEDRITTPGDEFRIAAKGPWVSLQLAAAFGLVTAGLDWLVLVPWLAAVLGLLGWFNLSLGVFNLLPGAPLDGGRILQAALWRLLGKRPLAVRGSAAVGVLLGLAMWGGAGWLVTTGPDAVWSALWLTLIAAFIVVMAVRVWRDAKQAPAPPQVATPAPTDAANRARTGWSATRVAAGVGSVVLVVAGAGIVPMPIIELSPGPTFDVPESLEVSGTTTPINGEAVMLTAMIRHPGIAEVLRAAVVDHRRLEPRQQVIPAGVGDRAYFSQQRDVFATSLDQAAAAALAAAGEDVEATIEVVVRNVLPDGPAGASLRPDDVLVAADGSPIPSVEALSELTAGLDVGATLDLVVRREGNRRDVAVPIGLLPGGQRTGIGITLGTVTAGLELPREVASTITSIGGPSAGLVTALSIYDLVSDDDVLGGRVVAATGTIDAAGRVGRIGSIPEKVAAAIDVGADVMLVPESQVSEALTAVDGRQLVVVGVATLDDAITSLVP